MGIYFHPITPSWGLLGINGRLQLPTNPHQWKISSTHQSPFIASNPNDRNGHENISPLGTGHYLWQGGSGSNDFLRENFSRPTHRAVENFGGPL